MPSSHRTESMYFSINLPISSLPLTTSSCLESSSILSDKLSSSLTMFLLSMNLSLVIFPSLYFSKAEVFSVSSLATCSSKSLMLILFVYSGLTSPYFSLIRAKTSSSSFSALKFLCSFTTPSVQVGFFLFSEDMMLYFLSPLYLQYLVLFNSTNLGIVI